jgi:GxxExxY protein
MKEEEITYIIRGAIYQVYVALGPGLLETVYEQALKIELESKGLTVKEQGEVEVIYKGHKINCNLRYDLLVNDSIIIELKAVEEMKKIFYKQIMTYLRLLNLHIGIIVNFNSSDILKSTTRVFNTLCSQKNL